jgi:hypothetical protein
MDKYTKFILTVIAVGVIGLNIHFFKDGLISNAKAEVSGMNYSELINDYDFDIAVRYVASKKCWAVGAGFLECKLGSLQDF